MITVHCGDCLELLPKLEPAKCIFVDPPDNIGLSYHDGGDNIPTAEYYSWLKRLLTACIQAAPVTWVSFNARYTIPMGNIVWELQRTLGIAFEDKPCVQVYTFGQHNQNDFGNNHRPLWRLCRADAVIYPENIRVESWRQKHGDKRADPRGRVPGDVFDMQYPDVDLCGCIGECSRGRLGYITGRTKLPWGLAWVGIGLDDGSPWSSRNPMLVSGGTSSGTVFDFPRVTGNSKQRQSWHPTQLHEDLVARCVLSCTEPGDKVIDPCAGTGSLGRACIMHGRDAVLIDKSEFYCSKLREQFAKEAA